MLNVYFLRVYEKWLKLFLILGNLEKYKISDKISLLFDLLRINNKKHQIKKIFPQTFDLLFLIKFI
jgi:hypothetical protein